MTNRPLTREPTEEENEEAKAVALGMTGALAQASSIPVGLGAISMLLEHAFINAIKPEYILASFDLFTADIRKKLEVGARRARN